MWIMHGHLDQNESVGSPSEPGGTEQAVEERTAAVPPMTDSITEHQPREAFNPEAGLPGYVLTHRLGQGSYGQVWQAVRVGAGQDVAVKIFTSPGRLDWRYLQREVDRLLRVAEHPHIVTLLDANLQHEPPFYVMTLLRAGSLAQLCHGGNRVDDVGQAAEWFEQIVRALDFAHGKGLLHCDLKPANVLLDEERNVRLVDFGQSHLRGEAARALGTLNYMAPEQAVVAGENEQPSDPSVSWDIYGIGATMYALLTGQAPHSHQGLERTLTTLPDMRERLAQYRRHMLTTPITPIRQLHSAVDRDLADIVEHCLQPDPARRYHHVGELAGDLRRRREHKPLRCHKPAKIYRLRKFVQRNLGMVLITIAAIIALATVSTTFYYTGTAKVEELRSERDEWILRFEREEQRADEAEQRLDELDQ